MNDQPTLSEESILLAGLDVTQVWVSVCDLSAYLVNYQNKGSLRDAYKNAVLRWNRRLPLRTRCSTPKNSSGILQGTSSAFDSCVTIDDNLKKCGENMSEKMMQQSGCTQGTILSVTSIKQINIVLDYGSILDGLLAQFEGWWLYLYRLCVVKIHLNVSTEIVFNT